MKTKMKILFVLMLLPLFAMAQEGQPQGQRMTPEQRASAEAKRMKEQLALNDSQTIKYEKIALKYNQQRREAFQNREDTALMRKKLNEVDTQMGEDLKVILTPEQYTKYEQSVAERRSRMGKGGRPSGPGDRQ